MQPLHAQNRAAIYGKIIDLQSGEPVAAVAVRIEGIPELALSDSSGGFRLHAVPPGPRVLIAERLGYAVVRIPISVPSSGEIVQDISLAANALGLPGLAVTAEVAGRARGELGTATVINREAIELQSASSLSGLLELLPGVQLQPPGLNGVEQFALRTVPVSGGVTSFTAGGPGAGDLGSFGTQIILDGVPISNNANLQTLGPRGELAVSSTAGGGIDLARIPAATLERVEVIRGIPSARFGDLTQGVIVVDTRAGAFVPDGRASIDPYTLGGTGRGGWAFGGQNALSINADLTRTRTEPGFRRDLRYRFASQLAHRTTLGRGADAAANARLTMDTRVDLFQVYQESPADDVAPGSSSSSRDRGARFSQRSSWRLNDQNSVEFTGAIDYNGQHSNRVAPRTRGALPFAGRVDEGRSFGRYIGGAYISELDIDGAAWNLFSRIELERRGHWFGQDHTLRGGVVLRREWNSGAGYQFDVEFPPQTSFNGVQGFDRPRRYDDIPATAASAIYLDTRTLNILPGGMSLDLQAGLRLDALHEGTNWFGSTRDAVIQPRLNAQLAPRDWLRLRAGWGQTAKIPTMDQLHPSPQYFDLVNVNWFTTDPTERLAVLSTFIRDPGNPQLGFIRGNKAEVGLEFSTRGGEAYMAVVGFSDRTTGGVGYRSDASFLLRSRYALQDSVIGDNLPTELVEPSTHADTVPILLDRPANVLTLENRGIEITARFPEVRAIRTRLEVQGAWIESDFQKEGVDFGTRFGDFQMDERIQRAPYWANISNTGMRALATYRLVHHQPSLGYVITATIQHVFRERTENIGANDSLAFEGYINRAGKLVPVVPEQRTIPEFRDLRNPRAGLVLRPNVVAPDWFASVRLTLSLPLDGRLSFYAFNALDRAGKPSTANQQGRAIPAMRFGLEGVIPFSGLGGAK